MSEQLLVGPATVFTNTGEHSVRPDSAVLCEDGRVAQVGLFSELTTRYPDAKRLDASGKIVFPGLINAHHHLYSTFARGMPIPAGTNMRNFCEILEGLWWRLDRAIDLDAVEAGAYHPVIDCLRWGTTTIVDHHASPNAITHSLDRLDRVCDELGVRASLCYEITDRNGPEGTAQGIEENARYADAVKDRPARCAMLGFHASFTVSDDTLQKAAQRLGPDIPIHIHVAEDAADVKLTEQRHQCGIIQRLQKFGLLRKNSIIVHGVHLDDEALKLVAKAGCWLVHNPESNANNAVGYLDAQHALDLGVNVVLGTDGMASNMLRAAKTAYFMLRNARRDPTVGFGLPRKLLLENNFAMGRELFGEPLLGTLQKGAPADLCVVAYDPPTPLDDNTFDGHFVYGITEAPVVATVTGGRVRMVDGVVVDFDIESVYRKVAAAVQQTWNKLQNS